MPPGIASIHAETNGSRNSLVTKTSSFSGSSDHECLIQLPLLLTRKICFGAMSLRTSGSRVDEEQTGSPMPLSLTRMIDTVESRDGSLQSSSSLATGNPLLV